MIKRFLYIEDGSVDVDLLQEELGIDTKIIIYRQGSQLPQLRELQEPAMDYNDNIIAQKDKEIKRLKECFKEIKQALKTRAQPKKIYSLMSEIWEECDIE